MNRLAVIMLAIVANACGTRMFEPCDVRQIDCQHSLRDALESLRAPSSIVPTVVIRTLDEVVTEFAGSATDEERASFVQRNDVLALFGLATPGLTLDESVARHYDQVNAFYSPLTREITIIDRGQDFAGPGMDLSFVHESVHAMQDGDGFLAAASAVTTDGSLAHESVLEGDATLFMDLASFELYGWEVSDARYDDALADWRDRNATAAFHSDRPVYDASFQFVYPFGTSYMRAAWDSGGWGAIVDVYRALPATTRAVMLDVASSVHLGVDAIAVPDPERTVVLADSLGYWNVTTWCRRLFDGDDGCDDALDDGITGIVSTDGTPLVGVWRIRFVDDSTAARIADAANTAGYSAAILGSDLVLTANAGELPLDYTSISIGWMAYDG